MRKVPSKQSIKQRANPSISDGGEEVGMSPIVNSIFESKLTGTNLVESITPTSCINMKTKLKYESSKWGRVQSQYRHHVIQSVCTFTTTFNLAIANIQRSITKHNYSMRVQFSISMQIELTRNYIFNVPYPISVRFQS